MRNPQMPNHGLERFGVRRDVGGIDCRDYNRHVRNLRRVSSVAADDSEDRATSFLRELQCAHQVRTDIFFKAAAAYRQHEDRVFFVESASLEPLGKNGGPSIIVGARRQLGDVIGGRVGFDSCELAKIVYRMRSIGRAASHAKNEQSAAARAHS